MALISVYIKQQSVFSGLCAFVRGALFFVSHKDTKMDNHHDKNKPESIDMALKSIRGRYRWFDILLWWFSRYGAVLPIGFPASVMLFQGTLLFRIKLILSAKSLISPAENSRPVLWSAINSR